MPHVSLSRFKPHSRKTNRTFLKRSNRLRYKMFAANMCYKPGRQLHASGWSEREGTVHLYEIESDGQCWWRRYCSLETDWSIQMCPSEQLHDATKHAQKEQKLASWSVCHSLPCAGHASMRKTGLVKTWGRGGIYISFINQWGHLWDVSKARSLVDGSAAFSASM